MNQLFFLITKAVVDRNQQTALPQHISLREKKIEFLYRIKGSREYKITEKFFDHLQNQTTA